MMVGGGILSGCGAAHAVANLADAKARLRGSVGKTTPSLAAAPQVELSALKAANSRIYAVTSRQRNYIPSWNQCLAGRTQYQKVTAAGNKSAMQSVSIVNWWVR
jgi:hypothetical protein